MDKNLFFYELEGRGYIFQNKKWDEAKHVFEDDMLNMAWEMWSSAKHSVKAQVVQEGFVVMPKDMTKDMVKSVWSSDYMLDFMRFRKSTFENALRGAYRTIIEAQERSHDS